HALASLCGFGFDLERYRAQILGCLHESADLAVHPSIRGVLRSQGVGVSAELGTGRCVETTEASAIHATVRENRKRRRGKRRQHESLVVHGDVKRLSATAAPVKMGAGICSGSLAPCP